MSSIFFAFWSFGKCALTIFPYLFLVSFLAAEKKRRAEEAQQSGPNASTQSNGTVSLLLLYKLYFLCLLLHYLIRLVLVLVQQLCDCNTEFCLSYQTTSLSLPHASWWCFWIQSLDFVLLFIYFVQANTRRSSWLLYVNCYRIRTK